MIGLFPISDAAAGAVSSISIVGSFSIEKNGNGQSVNQSLSSLSLQDDDLAVIMAGNDHVETHTFLVGENGGGNRAMTAQYSSHASGVNVVWATAGLNSDDTSVFETTQADATAAVVFVLRGASALISPSDYVIFNYPWGAPDPAGISVSAGDMVITAAFREDTNAVMSPPAGYELLNRAEAFEGVFGNENVSMCVAYKVMSSAGTENPGPFSVSGGNNYSTLTWRVAAAS